MTQEGTTNTTKRTTTLIGSSRFLPIFFSFAPCTILIRPIEPVGDKVEDDKLLAYWTSPVYLPVMASLLMLVSVFQG
jgi:hypothetical protein